MRSGNWFIKAQALINLICLIIDDGESLHILFDELVFLCSLFVMDIIVKVS